MGWILNNLRCEVAGDTHDLMRSQHRPPGIAACLIVATALLAASVIWYSGSGLAPGVVDVTMPVAVSTGGRRATVTPPLTTGLPAFCVFDDPASSVVEQAAASSVVEQAAASSSSSTGQYRPGDELRLVPLQATSPPFPDSPLSTNVTERGDALDAPFATCLCPRYEQST